MFRIVPKLYFYKLHIFLVVVSINRYIALSLHGNTNRFLKYEFLITNR